MARSTRQRRVILEELSKVKTHPTADQMYRMVRRRLPRVSLATVYRNLELLAASGIIMKLEMGGSKRRYDGTVKTHYHVRCSKCGQIEDLMMEPLHLIEQKVQKYTDYEILGHQLEFRGVCPKCNSAH